MSDILTEEQAKTKWCPYTRIAVTSKYEDDDGLTVNMPTINRPVQDHMRCIASECMAWRIVWSDAANEPRGYCGAFGKATGA